MSVARVIELSAVSPESHEAAIREAVDRATRTLRGVRSAWIKDMNVVLDESGISGFQVNMAFTFVLEEGEAMPEFEGTMGATLDEDIQRGTPADSVTAGGAARGGMSASPEARGGGTAPGTTPAREVPPRGEEVPSGSPPQAPPGDIQSETSPEPSPRTQEERPVRQSERRREEDRGREDDRSLIDRPVDSLTGREEEPRRGEEPDRPRR